MISPEYTPYKGILRLVGMGDTKRISRIRAQILEDSRGVLDICISEQIPSALLSPGGDEQEDEEPLKPEDNLDKYDRERLQKGLRYINGALYSQRLTT